MPWNMKKYSRANSLSVKSRSSQLRILDTQPLAVCDHNSNTQVKVLVLKYVFQFGISWNVAPLLIKVRSISLHPLRTASFLQSHFWLGSSTTCD
ncbi:hypothetical protein Plhal304r1_c013g0050101 [Plasmopara halstedii]